MMLPNCRRHMSSCDAVQVRYPLPACDREIGIDIGLGRLVATSDGEIIVNPRFLRAKERRLARAQRALSRTRQGSTNREKARRRVAALHRKVRETRLDHAHKTALRLVRDKPLGVRLWTCAECGVIHDRDVNAARNILAAGRADRLNACGDGIRPSLAMAAVSEAGTHRGAA